MTTSNDSNITEEEVLTALSDLGHDPSLGDVAALMPKLREQRIEEGVTRPDLIRYAVSVALAPAPSESEPSVQGLAQSHSATISLWHSGDASVGLPGDTADVTLDLSGYSPEDRYQYVIQASEALKDAFSGLWDTRAKVAIKGNAPIPAPAPDLANKIVVATRATRLYSNYPETRLAFTRLTDLHDPLCAALATQPTGITTTPICGNIFWLEPVPDAKTPSYVLLFAPETAHGVVKGIPLDELDDVTSTDIHVFKAGIEEFLGFPTFALPPEAGIGAAQPLTVHSYTGQKMFDTPRLTQISLLPNGTLPHILTAAQNSMLELSLHLADRSQPSRERYRLGRAMDGLAAAIGGIRAGDPPLPALLFRQLGAAHDVLHEFYATPDTKIGRAATGAMNDLRVARTILEHGIEAAASRLPIKARYATVPKQTPRHEGPSI